MAARGVLISQTYEKHIISLKIRPSLLVIASVLMDDLHSAETSGRALRDQRRDPGCWGISGAEME